MKMNQYEKFIEKLGIEASITIHILLQQYLRGQTDLFVTDIEKEFLKRTQKIRNQIIIPQRIRYILTQLQQFQIIEIYHKTYNEKKGNTIYTRGKKTIKILPQITKETKLLQKAEEIIEHAHKPHLYQEKNIKNFFKNIIR